VPPKWRHRKFESSDLIHQEIAMNRFIICACVLQTLSNDSASAQSSADVHPFYTRWEKRETGGLGTRSDGVKWAAAQLNLTNPAIPKRAMKRVTKARPHVAGRMLLATATPEQRYETILFREVSSDEEYNDCLEDIENGYEVRGELSGATLSYDGPPERRVIKYNRTWMDREKSVTITERQGIRMLMKRTIRDADGNPKMIERTVSDTLFVRRVNDYLLSGHPPEVFRVSPDAVYRRSQFQNDDTTVYVDMERISPRIREQIWQQIETQMATQLQQFDKEKQLDFAARRLWGQNHLEVLRATFFDLRNAWYSLSSVDEAKPIRLSAGLEATTRSKLAETLRHLGSAARYLPDISRPEDVLVLHWCCRIPPTLNEFLHAVVDVVQTQFSHADLPEVLDRSIDDGVLESQIVVRADPVHGIVGLGVLRIRNDDRAELVDSISKLAALLPNVEPERFLSESGRVFLRLRLDALQSLQPKFFSEWDFISLPEYGFLHFDEKCCWFGCGSRESWNVLEKQVMASNETQENDSRTSRGLLICRVNLEHATWEDDNASTLANWLIDMEQRFARWHTARLTAAFRSMGRRDLENPKPDATYATASRKALSTGTSRGELRLFNDGDGIRAELTADRALALLYFGRAAANGEETRRLLLGAGPQRKVQTVEDIRKAPKKTAPE
jgi:hypothetical protein